MKTYIQICTKSLNIKYTVTLTSHCSRTNNHCTETHVCTTLSFRVTIRLVTLLYTIYAILVTYFLCVLFVRQCCIFIMTRGRTLPYFWRYKHISIRTRTHHYPNEQTPPTSTTRGGRDPVAFGLEHLGERLDRVSKAPC